MFFRKPLAVAASFVLVALSAPAHASVATFESQLAFRCDSWNQSDGGLEFSFTGAACFYSPAQPRDFPSVPPSTVMAIGWDSDATVRKTGGGVFNLDSVDLAFGPFGHGGLQSDTTLVTGYRVGGGTVSSLLTVDYSFDTYVLDWSGLTSVVFSKLQGGGQYLAFDNVTFDSHAVPEPSSLSLVALAVVGLAAFRRKKARKAVVLS